MTAEIVSVGTELLLGQIVDTNAATLSKVLADCGIYCYYRQTVGDNLQRLTSALQLAMSRSDLVFTIGGLGPTQDDLTREGVAKALNVTMELDQEVLQGLKYLFSERKLNWIESQSRQAMKPLGAEIIPNPNGTAPGLLCRAGDQIVLCLPGPRGEFNPMANGFVRNFLSKQSGQVISSRIIRVIGIGEAAIEQKLLDLIQSESPTVAPYAKVGEVHLRITASAKNQEEADRLIEPVFAEISERLRGHIYGYDDDPIEKSVQRLLAERKKTLVTAESCTGGLIAKRLTDLPGSSEVFLGAFVTYSNSLKELLLDVSKDTLETHGAVSAECAIEMACGARERTGADYSLSVTGIAGPDGGSEHKPVGLVFVGYADASNVEVQELRLRGIRDDVRTRSANAAFDLLRNKLMQI